ncbi:hypothetical protein Phep_0759 [Pedobacter heparinus DSM 2366]|uniref:DUF4185 domain-containing protein n=2 Tax=Pedobacter heparinus TaxID=984 RepID=C6Y1K5_PEDHD|nr:hypothetical protein Phep_0759 [Pedobacter heparinus DSM 2366]
MLNLLVMRHSILKNSRLGLIAILVFCAGIAGKAQQKQHELTQVKFSVEEAPEWSNIFKRQLGWFGGDGIFAIPANGNDKAVGGEITLLFSDTMVGEIKADQLKPGFVMTHNSVATFRKGTVPKGSIKFHIDKKADGKPESLFIPKTARTKAGDYYWLGDGFVNQELKGQTYIFGYRIRDIKGKTPFGFEHVGTTLIVLPKGSKPPYKDQRQLDVPLFVAAKDGGEPTAYGSGIFVNTAKAGAKNPDGYVYVYGVKGPGKSLIVSRVLPKDFEDFKKWRFWDGKQWNPDIQASKGVTDRVSNELSVSEIPDGRYALVFQVDGISSVIGMRLGSSPAGPFGPIINLYDSKADLLAPKIFSYNAKAHPSLSKPGELLISYNVNSFDFDKDILLYPNLYRPRFINVKFKP